MNPDNQFAFEGLDPANRFTMDGLNMAFTTELIADGKPLPKDFFLDIMIEKNSNVGYPPETSPIGTCASSEY